MMGYGTGTVLVSLDESLNQGRVVEFVSRTGEYIFTYGGSEVDQSSREAKVVVTVDRQNHRSKNRNSDK